MSVTRVQKSWWVKYRVTATTTLVHSNHNMHTLYKHSPALGCVLEVEYHLPCQHTCYFSIWKWPCKVNHYPHLCLWPVCLYQNGADIRPVDKPQKAAIHVFLNWLHPCPVEIVNQEWTAVGASSTPPVDSTTARMKDSMLESFLVEDTAWNGRLRPRQSSDRDARSKNGEM